MVATVLADTVVSVSDLKKNPIKVVEQGEGFPIALRCSIEITLLFIVCLLRLMKL